MIAAVEQYSAGSALQELDASGKLKIVRWSIQRTRFAPVGGSYAHRCWLRERRHGYVGPGNQRTGAGAREGESTNGYDI